LTTVVESVYCLYRATQVQGAQHMEKLFTVAGTSNLNGVVKFRFANDLKSRVKVLQRNGHTDIDLMELPTEMTKEQAIAFLEAQDTPAEDTAVETAESVRESLEADGEDTSEMTAEFLAEVAARENA
jgi:hypothetical protein